MSELTVLDLPTTAQELTADCLRLGPSHIRMTSTSSPMKGQPQQNESKK